MFWAVLSYTVTSHEQSLHLRWTTKRPAATAYTSLPTFEAAHILIQDLSHSFLFYVLLLPFQIVFAPKSTFPFIGSEIYVRVASFSRSQVGACRLWDSQWHQAQLDVLQSHLLDFGHQKRIVSLPCTLTERFTFHKETHMWTASGSLLRNGRFPTYFFHNSLSLAVVRSVTMAH